VAAAAEAEEVSLGPSRRARGGGRSGRARRSPRGDPGRADGPAPSGTPSRGRRRVRARASGDPAPSRASLRNLLTPSRSPRGPARELSPDPSPICPICPGSPQGGPAGFPGAPSPSSCFLQGPTRVLPDPRPVASSPTVAKKKNTWWRPLLERSHRVSPTSAPGLPKSSKPVSCGDPLKSSQIRGIPESPDLLCIVQYVPQACPSSVPGFSLLLLLTPF
jgi:hypothetical protein